MQTSPWTIKRSSSVLMQMGGWPRWETVNRFKSQAPATALIRGAARSVPIFVIFLSEELGVSRFWIRDAFKILETKGLIKVIPYKGAVVCDLDEQEIEQIFEVRQELDALATRKAAQNVKKPDLHFLKRMAQQFEKSVRRADFGEMISANENFHDYIYELSRNQALIQMINQLKTRGHILRYYAWSSLDAIQRIQREHRLFIKGLEKKDLKLLDDLARRHISYSKDSYLMHLKAKKANSLNPTR